jgi:hypothetical protein
VLGDSLVTLKEDGKVSSIWYRCLLDTVDPDQRLLVFTKFKDTLDYLVTQ